MPGSCQPAFKILIFPVLYDACLSAGYRLFVFCVTAVVGELHLSTVGKLVSTGNIPNFTRVKDAYGPTDGTVALRRTTVGRSFSCRNVQEREYTLPY